MTQKGNYQRLRLGDKNDDLAAKKRRSRKIQSIDHEKHEMTQKRTHQRLRLGDKKMI
jgi:hypothetical protein